MPICTHTHTHTHKKTLLGSMTKPCKNFICIVTFSTPLTEDPKTSPNTFFIKNSVNLTVVGFRGCQLWILIWAVNILIWAMNTSYEESPLIGLQYTNGYTDLDDTSHDSSQKSRVDMWLPYSLAKECPWVEHITSLVIRGVGTLLGVSAFNHGRVPMLCLQALDANNWTNKNV